MPSCLELGLPKRLRPGMPVMRMFGSKSLTFGLMVRAFTSPEPFGQLRGEVLGRVEELHVAVVVLVPTRPRSSEFLTNS